MSTDSSFSTPHHAAHVTPVTTGVNPYAGYPALLEMHHVEKLTGYSARHINRMVNAGAMPGKVRQGDSRSVRFRLTEIAAWIENDCKPINGGDQQ